MEDNPIPTGTQTFSAETQQSREEVPLVEGDVSGDGLYVKERE